LTFIPVHFVGFAVLIQSIQLSIIRNLFNIGNDFSENERYCAISKKKLRQRKVNKEKETFF